MLIPLKGMIESSKQNSCLMRSPPPLLLLMADDDGSRVQVSAIDSGAGASSGEGGGAAESERSEAGRRVAMKHSCTWGFFA